MIIKNTYMAHIAHRGGEVTRSAVAASWGQAAEAIVSQNLNLFPVSREAGSDEHRFVLYVAGETAKAYMTVLVTAQGSVIARYPYVVVPPLPLRFDPPPFRKYVIKAAGWPEMACWSDDISGAVNDYFAELIEDTDFNPAANRDINVQIWTESLKDPSLVHVWNWTADVELEAVAHCRGRERSETMKKELLA